MEVVSFTSQTKNRYTTDQERESPVRTMLRNECSDENCWREPFYKKKECQAPMIECR